MFKRNLKFESECTDISLSDTKPASSSECSHNHIHNCTDCNALEFFLKRVNEEIESKIRDYKIKDNSLYDLLNNLHDDEVYIHSDWAIKFLTVFFQEKQEDFFNFKALY